MARIDTLSNFLTDVADSIREKTGNTEPIACEDFDTEIESIETGGGDFKITDGSYLFYSGARNSQFDDIMSILGALTTTVNMFQLNSTLNKSVVLTNQNLDSLTNANSYYQMFAGCQKVPEISLSSTSTVPTSCGSMFSNCYQLEKLTLNINTTNVTYYGAMFGSCKKLKALDLTNFNFSKVTNANNMPSFYHCEILENLILPNSFYEKINSLNGMPSALFGYCYKLPVNDFFEKYTGTRLTSEAFTQCKLLTIKTLPDSITYVGDRAFQYCTGLTQLSENNVRNFYCTASGNPVFVGCSNMIAIWCGSALTTTNNYSFLGMSKLKKLFIDKPRATVEAMTGYAQAFQGNTGQAAKDKIICNDDAGFMTKAQFDAIDWENYTEE